MEKNHGWGRFGVLALLAACTLPKNDDSAIEERVYVSDPTHDNSESDDSPADMPHDTSAEDAEEIEEADGEGGSSEALELPFAEGEVWAMTRGYNTDSHRDYGYNWYDDSYALDFALAGCDSWRKSAMPIRSGTVETVGYDEDGYGHYVLVDHGNGYKSRYAHFDETAVSTGQSVTQHTTLGYVGNSGNVTGSACPDHPGTHLHVAYYKDGEAELPEPMSGHVDFTAGCWYGHDGWFDCDGDDLDDNTGESSSSGGESEEDSGSGTSESGEEETEEEVDEEEADDCTWTVPGDFTTIQDAIDVASSGEVVCVSADSYTEDLTFTGQDITVRGIDGAANTHLYGVAVGSYESVVTVESGESDAAVLEGFTVHPTTEARGVTVTWSSITLRNLIIDCNEDGKYGLMLEAANGVSVSNTWIIDCSTYGVYAPAATDIHVNNLIVSGSGAAGLRVAGGGDVEVVNSVFYANRFNGVDVRDSDATVENSILVGHSEYALYVGGSGATLTSGYNTFDDNDIGSYSEDVRTTSGNSVEDPDFTNATGEDFTLRSSSPCINAGDPDSAMDDADGTRNDKGAYGGPSGESW